MTAFEYPDFEPHPLLTNRHAMTIASGRWPRRLSFGKTAGEPRQFEVEPGVEVLAYCHWQPASRKRPTLILVHGLEGSSDSPYILGAAEKAFALGMNVLRLNQRNCGGTLHLTPTLYNSGLSSDPLAVIRELTDTDGLGPFFLAGWSMGGNLVLKAAAELRDNARGLLMGVCAVSPSLDLEPCVQALETGFNKVYEQWFLKGLKTKLREKSKLYPDLYDAGHLDAISLIREFDNVYTAPGGGYGDAANYYKTASALPMVHEISVPTLIIQAKDDPFVPFQSFLSPQLQSQHITLIATEHGGHCGFLHKSRENAPFADRFWAENRVISFCATIAQQMPA